MTTLITGGSSKVGTALARLLAASNRPVLFGSRSGKVPSPFDGVKFDWHDATTFENPFSSSLKSAQIELVYILLPPTDTHPETSVNPFIDIAIAKGVKRFVVLSGSFRTEDLATEDLASHGVLIQNYLNEKGVEYVIVKPTWFIENFATIFGPGIRGADTFTTSIPTAKIPFIGVDDIAQAAYEAIVSETNDVKEKFVIGPELLTYDQAAEILSKVTGRKITHKSISKDELISLYQSFGFKPESATFFAKIEARTEAGSEERLLELDDRVKHVGKVTVKQWAEENVNLLRHD